MTPAIPPFQPIYYITYQSASKLGGCYSTIHANSMEDARAAVFAVTKGDHAFIYGEVDWIDETGETQAERYKLRIVQLQPAGMLARKKEWPFPSNIAEGGCDDDY